MLTNAVFNKTEFYTRLDSEQKLIVLCSRLSMDEKQRALAADLLKGPLDWQEVLDLSLRHLVTGLMYRTLEKNGLIEAVPEDVRVKMRGFTTKNLALNMQKRVELLKILNYFGAAGIKVVVLKGNALVHTVYRDESLRVFTDIDLLIPREDLEKTKKAMTAELGYRLVTDNYPVEDELNEEFGCEWTYQNEAGIITEIHWDLLDKGSPFKLDAAQMIQRAVTFSLGDVDALCLATEDEIIHLCIHQYKHHWQRLRDICDLNEILSQSRIHWDVLLDRSRQIAADKCLYYTFLLAQHTLDAPIPEDVLTELHGRVRPGILSRSIFDLIEKNILAYQSPHGYWPVILVDGFRERSKIVKKHVSKKREPKSQTPVDAEGIHKTDGSVRQHIRMAASSALSYRPLLRQLIINLFRNTTSLAGSLRRGRKRD